LKKALFLFSCSKDINKLFSITKSKKKKKNKKKCDFKQTNKQKKKLF